MGRIFHLSITYSLIHQENTLRFIIQRTRRKFQKMGRVFSSIHKVQSHPSRKHSQVHNLKNQEKISEMGRSFHLLFGSLLSLLLISPITQALYSRLRHLLELTWSSLTTCQRHRHVHLRVDVMTYLCIGEGRFPRVSSNLRVIA